MNITPELALRNFGFRAFPVPRDSRERYFGKIVTKYGDITTMAVDRLIVEAEQLSVRPGTL